MDSLVQDLRQGLRLLMQRPGFTAVATATLALGIGATTALFSVVNGVLLRPLPLGHPERLVWIWGQWSQGSYASVSPPDFLDYRDRTRTFERLAAMTSFSDAWNLASAGEPEQVRGRLASAGFFETIGVEPLLGRGFTLEDEKVAAPQVVILGHGLWQRRFGADPGVIGRAVEIDGQSVAVVGVLPAELRFPLEVEVWQPLPVLAPGMKVRRSHFLRPVGRLAPGVGLARAQAEMDALARDLEREHPDSNATWALRLVALQEQIVGSVRPALLVLLGAVGLVLLIACANVANLLLFRCVGRRKELGIRAALGANRTRLLRQLLTESVLLAFLGGAAGLLLAAWGLDTLRAVGSASVPRIDEVTVDLRVLVFAVLTSLATALVFGVVPAWRATRIDPYEAVREGGRSSAGVPRRRLRSLLVVSELALSVVLLVGACLLLRSFWRLTAVDPGFRADHLLTTSLALPDSKYPRPEQRAEFMTALVERIEALPGVQSAGAVSELPLTGQDNDTYFTVVGRSVPPGGGASVANVRSVSRGYFRSMGIRLLAGRVIDGRDTRGAGDVVVINEPMAKQLFPEEDPLGKRLAIDLGRPFEAEIVGVVEGIRHYTLAVDPQPEMYVSYPQAPRHGMNLVVRSRTEPAKLAPSVRSAVAAIDPGQALAEFATMDEILIRSVAAPQFWTSLLSIFAGMALVLAAVGLYGVMSYSVTERTREIGVRMALGARRADVLREVVGQGMQLAAGGVVIGFVLALGVARLLMGFLFGVAPNDPMTFAGVPLVLAAVAFAASAIPALRATKVDPILALRCE